MGCKPKLGLLALAMVSFAGCQGSATVRIVPLMRSDIGPREPLVQEVAVDQAYYWLEGEELNIALRCHRSSVLGAAFEYDWQMSLVLEALPAGSSRLYKLKSDAIRIVQTFGAGQNRCRTWSGVAVIEAPEGGRLQGRFHANVRQQTFTLLKGWQPPPLQAPMMIVVGQFDAVNDADRGRAIRAETEAVGFERVSRPATRPTRID